jgi:hypothetical protein
MAGILGLVGGAYHLISGAAAIAEDDLTEAAGQILFDIDITVWGWFWVVVGAIQVVASILILLRNPVGRVLGIGIATVSAFCTVFLIFVFPIWALVVLAVDLFVITQLVITPEEWER